MVTLLMEFYNRMKNSFYYVNMKEIEELLKIIYDTIPGGTLYNSTTILPGELITKLGLTNRTLDQEHRQINADTVYNTFKSVCNSNKRNVPSEQFVKGILQKETPLLSNKFNEQIASIDKQITSIDNQIRELNIK